MPPAFGGQHALAASPHVPGSLPPGVHHGHPESLEDDFGAGDGYSGTGAIGREIGTTYGSVTAGTHGRGSGDYGPPGNDHIFQAKSGTVYGAAREDGNAYGPDPLDGRGYEAGQGTGDPNYRGRRHRPSANDTNVGSIEDFASYGGWSAGR